MCDNRINDQKWSKQTMMRSVNNNVVEVEMEIGIWKRHTNQILLIVNKTHREVGV